ncbi:hypothetical protein Areg01_69240 [Actinoplanes regularis]|nr:hypothetical protein Areg01_69240 [Actinoplanes regularis]
MSGPAAEVGWAAPGTGEFGVSDSPGRFAPMPGIRAARGEPAGLGLTFVPRPTGGVSGPPGTPSGDASLILGM